MKNSFKVTLCMLMLMGSSFSFKSHAQLKTYMGLLHAHTMISDGSGTPQEAFDMAKQNGLDFFAVTPHNHAKAELGAREARRDGVLIATNHDLYNGSSDVAVTRRWKENGVSKTENVTLKPLLKAAAAVTNQNFVALYGQEFSTISSGNHINVIGIDEVITVNNGDFKGLIALLESLKSQGKRAPVLQLNHPDVHLDLFYNGANPDTKEKMFNDFGIDNGDLGPHFKDLVKALDAYVCMIEVLSGPAMQEQREDNFRYHANDDDYFFYLKEGFHVSPSAGQDNHFKTWGKITDARTGVLASALTENALLDAFRRHRTFATEDKNLHVSLTVNDTLMGWSVTTVDESELNIRLKIEDADETTATYKIQIYGGSINSELSTSATEWKAVDGLLNESTLTGNGLFTIKNIFASPQPYFIYIKITQNDGDRAWTAPVWLNYPPASTSSQAQAAFFWTKSSSSHVFHLEGCSSIKLIKPENLMSGDTPPEGRTQHDCNVQVPDEE